MKVGKDEIIGAYVALEQWVRGGAARAMERWRECISIMKREFLSLPGLAVEEMEPDSAFCNPRIAVSWQAKRFPVNADVIAKRLGTGRPRIVLHDCWQRPQRIVVDPTNLTKVEAEIVGRSIVHAISEPPLAPYGAGKTMKVASFVGAVSLGIAATSWNAVVFAIALFGMQLASAFLFYEAAFVFLVHHAKRQMAVLTLSRRFLVNAVLAVDLVVAHVDMLEASLLDLWRLQCFPRPPFHPIGSWEVLRKACGSEHGLWLARPVLFQAD